MTKSSKGRCGYCGVKRCMHCGRCPNIDCEASTSCDYGQRAEQVLPPHPAHPRGLSPTAERELAHAREAHGPTQHPCVPGVDRYDPRTWHPRHAAYIDAIRGAAGPLGVPLGTDLFWGAEYIARRVEPVEGP